MRLLLPILFLALVRPLELHAQLTANAGNDRTICSGSTTNLGGSPTASGGQGPYTYSWSPATGLNSTTVANPTATVNGATTYTVTITDSSNPPNSTTDQVTVGTMPSPTPMLTMDPADPLVVTTTFNGNTAFTICGQNLPSHTFNFIDNSTAQGGATYSVAWGSPPSPSTFPSSGWTAQHTFGIGMTTINYTITNPNNCAVTEQFHVYLGSNPSVGINNPGGTINLCTGDELCLPITATANNTPGTQYTVEFGDGTDTVFFQPAPAEICHAWDVNSCDVPPYFTVRITAVNPCSTFPSFGTAGPIVVSQAPTATFTIAQGDTVCAGSLVNFSNTSQSFEAPSCTTPRQVWHVSPATGWSSGSNLGSLNNAPGSPSSWSSGSASPALQFSTPGNYCVTLITGNPSCGVDSLTQCICVEAPPQPAFTLAPTTGCTPLAPVLDNTSQSPNSCLTRYSWELTTTSSSCNSGATASYTGGSSSSSFEPSVVFTGAGTYNVRLRATNSCGTFPVDRTVSVGAPPEVTINAIPGICPGDPVSPTAVFTACNTPITNYTWSFVDGTPNFATTAVPGPITFNNPGTWGVTATAASACGSGTDASSVVVAPAPAAPVVDGPIAVCAGEAIVLQAVPVNGITVTWTGPGGFSQTGNTVTIPSATAAMSGTYTAVPGGGGCPGPSSTVQVTVTPTPVISITPAAPSVCQGQPVTLTAAGGGNYSWTVGGSPQGTGPSITFIPSGTVPVVVTSGQGNCPGSASITVNVDPLPAVNAGPDHVFCAQAIPETLTPITPGGTWSGGGVSAGGVFTPGTTGTFVLTYSVTSAANCTNSDAVQVVVGPVPPDPIVGNDTLVCLHSGDLALQAQPAGGTWSGGATPGGVFTPGTAGTFPLTYTVGSGSCAVSSTLTVQVVNAAVVSAGADLARCIDAVPVVLNGTPAAGTWSGPGVTGNSFDPGAANVGSHVLTYTYSDPNGCVVSDALNAEVHDLPGVDAGADVTFCDQPLPQQLGGGTPAGGSWTGANVSTDGLFTPAGVGSFPLTYEYIDANGCSNSASITVTVIAIDNPADAGTDDALCIGSGDLLLSGAPVGGTWSGSSVSGVGLFTPSTAGDHTLTYSVGTGSCITSDQVIITVHPLPQPQITSSTSVCLDAGVQSLTATPTGGTWSGTGVVDPANGLFDPTVSGVGSFGVTYAYTDGNGCTNTTSAQATVEPLPVAAFSNAPIACVGVPFPFTDGSSGNSAWDWDFGDGDGSTAASPEHTYTATGTYPVTLTVSTGPGCTHSTTGSVTVWEGPTAAFTAGPELAGCAVLTVGVQDQSSGEGISHVWDMGNGTTSTAVQPPPVDYVASAFRDTVYTITLSVTNQCATATSSVDITVHPAPTALFGPDFDTGCSPWPVTFSNVSIGQASDFVWDFGDGVTLATVDSLVTHTYTTDADDTTFTVTLTATNQCGTDVHSYDVTVQPNDITAFFNTSITSGCAPLTVDFTQFSIGVTNWHWDLGDGNMSTAPDVTHTYSAGTWTATLFADNGCSHDTVSVAIDVSPTPTVVFDISPQPVCAGMPVTLTNLTPAVASTTWTLPGGITSTLGTLEHTFATAGTHAVSLTVTSIDNGCAATGTGVVQVSPVPVAGFTVSEAVYCAPADITFTNTSTGTGLSSTWSIDGNTFSFLQHPLPQHMALAGGHDVQLLVVDPLSGCRDSIAQPIMGNATPEASFVLQPVDPCGRPAIIEATSTATTGAQLSWRLNGGLLGTTPQLQAEAIGAGSYTLELVAELVGPCSDTAEATFDLYELPVASFTADTACVGQPIPITDSSTHFTAQWWYLNGRPVGSDPLTMAMIPRSPGIDTIALSVVGEGGCMDSLVRYVNTYVAPPAAMTVEVLDDCRSIRLHGNEHPQVEYAWYVNDLASPFSTDREPWYFYAPNTLLDLHFTMEVTNMHGCTSVDQRPVELPLCAFVPNAFTPDGDGINETFLPSVTPTAKWSWFRVFDRWGEEIFTTAPGGPEWDGTANGKPAPPGVYVWRLELTPTDEAQDPLYGHVTLVR